MELVAGFLMTGLAVGATYAMGTLALSMIWGSLGMLNLAHGSILALGAYASYQAVALLGLPWWTGIMAAIVMGAVLGAVLYFGIVRWIFDKPNFPITTVIATIAAAAILDNFVTQYYGAEAHMQPFSTDGSLRLPWVTVRLQPLLVLAIAAVMTVIIAWFLSSTRSGRAIRAVSQQRLAASLMGIPVRRVLLQVLILSGVISAISGLMLTGITTIYPSVGAVPTVKALVICAVAGLGSLWGATGIAVAFGMFEVFIQYTVGTRFGFPATLGVAILLLIWKPYGLFGQSGGVRV